MARKYGGVTLVKGTRIKWATLASLIVGGPLYAYYVGAIAFLGDIGDGIVTGIDGVRTFVVGGIDGAYDAIAFSISQTWWSYWSAARSTFGPFAWHVTLVVTLVSMWLLTVMLRRVVARG